MKHYLKAEDVLTPNQIENIKKLGDYLEKCDLKARFDMAFFFVDHPNSPEYGTTCGSAGCAIGHGPFAGIRKLSNESWIAYAKKNFVGKTYKNPVWEFLFSETWGTIDNTPLGVGRRIRTFLEIGVPNIENPDRRQLVAYMHLSWNKNYTPSGDKKETY